MLLALLRLFALLAFLAFLAFTLTSIFSDSLGMSLGMSLGLRDVASLGLAAILCGIQS